MHEPGTAVIIAQTKKWIADVVAGCNFCPFAAREIKRGSIHYTVLQDATLKNALEAVAVAFVHLNDHPETETSFLILPGSFMALDDYLQLVELSDALIEREDYEGIYQVASFHPAYLFAGSNEEDPSNYTNRSPYPMLHFLREESISKAVDAYPDIDDVTEKNISFTQEKGLKYMQQMLAACMQNEIE
jgi:hypothetical protein